MSPMLLTLAMASAFDRRNYQANLNAGISSALDLGNKNAQTMYAVLNSNNLQDSNRLSARNSARGVVRELFDAIQSGVDRETYEKDWPRLSETFTYEELERMVSDANQNEQEKRKANAGKENIGGKGGLMLAQAERERLSAKEAHAKAEQERMAAQEAITKELMKAVKEKAFNKDKEHYEKSYPSLSAEVTFEDFKQLYEAL